MNKYTDETFDAIVAGGGLGGLFAAAKLVKEGKKVILLERHTLLGGYASYFNRKGFRFETALHALDGLFGGHGGNVELFEEFGLFDKLNIIRLEEFYRVLGKDVDISLPDNENDAREILLKRFPEESKGIKGFFSLTQKVYKQAMSVRHLTFKDFIILPRLAYKLKDLLKYFRKTHSQYINSITNNELLKMILAANTQYYHDDPLKHSAVHFLGAQASYYGGGASLIQGGSYALVQALSDYITDNGGEIRVSSDVTSIHVRQNMATGVTYTDLKTNETHSIYSKQIAVNLPYPKMIDMLAPVAQVQFDERFENFSHSPSAFTLYIGLKKELSETGMTNYSSILFPENYTTLDHMNQFNYCDNYGERIIFITNYSAVDLFPETGNKPTVSCLVMDKIAKWEDLTPEQYKEKKELHCEELIATVDKQFPGFRDNIEYVSIASPKTYERYTGNKGGAIYGFAQDVNQLGPFRPKNKTKVKGLYLASAWSFPGGGMLPSSKAGYRAAQEMLKEK